MTHNRVQLLQRTLAAALPKSELVERVAVGGDQLGADGGIGQVADLGTCIHFVEHLQSLEREDSESAVCAAASRNDGGV